MNILQNLLYGGQQIGGALGRVLQPIGASMGSGNPMALTTGESGGMPTGNRVMQNPAYASALTRLGANLGAAATQGGSFLDNVSMAVPATIQQMDGLRAQNSEIALRNAQVQQAMTPKGPFSGDGFENQAAGARYAYYISQGMDEVEARNRAAADVFNRETSYIKAADGSMVPVPGRQLPAYSAGQAVMPSAAIQAPNEGMLPQPNQSAPIDGLLPPPAELGVGEARMPSTSFKGTPNAQNSYDTKKADIAAQRDANGGVLPLTEAQGQAVARSNMLMQGLSEYQNYIFNPEVRPGAVAVADALEQTGNPLAKFAATKMVRNDSENMLKAAEARSLEALASSVTGAGVTADQFTRFQTMLPSVNDSDQNKQKKIMAAYEYLMGLSNLSGDYKTILQAQIQTMKPKEQTGGIPKGVDPAVWAVMTPEEQGLWQ
jgi:hypothetical protein